ARHQLTEFRASGTLYAAIGVSVEDDRRIEKRDTQVVLACLQRPEEGVNRAAGNPARLLVRRDDEESIVEPVVGTNDRHAVGVPATYERVYASEESFRVRAKQRLRR